MVITMRNISNIVNAIQPIFDSHDYTCEILSPDQIRFVNTANSINISFDITGPHLSELDVLDCAIRAQYALRFGAYWVVIDPKHIITNEVIETSLFYTNCDEQIDAAVRLGKQATEIVLPLIEGVVDTAVFPTDTLYEKLSQISLPAVTAFAKEHELEFQATCKNLDQVKSILESWIPTEVDEKQDTFEVKIEDILKLAAYIGNTLIKSCGGSWEWETIRRYGSEVVFSHEYYVSYYDNDGDQQEFDPLFHVLMHWNLHNVVQFSGLDSSVCKECFCNN